MKLVWGSVTRIVRDLADLVELEVSLDGGAEGRALCYPQLIGRCGVGDRVLLNTTAVELGLGTGGTHFVVAHGCEGVSLDASSGGHIMKARYTPLQVDVLAVEAQESEHHSTMQEAVSLEGMPVVCCGLHSQVPIVAAGVKAASPSLRVAYCMTDGAALPMALSDAVRASKRAGLIDSTLACGQAFGGDLEAVNVHSGLVAARHVAAADVAVVAIGPGVTGTATPFGHGGIAQGEAINAVSVLGGRPVACLRVSFADARERHRGVSHHTLAALTKVALARAYVAVPERPAEFLDSIEIVLAEAGVWTVHKRLGSTLGVPDPSHLRGVEVTTMGRGLVDDPAFFAAAFAAGEIASRLALSVLR